MASCSVNAQGGLYRTNAVLSAAEQVLKAPQQRLGTCNKRRAHAGMFDAASASRELQGTPKIMAAATTLKAPSTYIGRLWTQPRASHAAVLTKIATATGHTPGLPAIAFVDKAAEAVVSNSSHAFQPFAGADHTY